MHSAALSLYDPEKILTILGELPKGISEYHLIEKLNNDQSPDLQDPLILFRNHFMLFHQLYKLRDMLWQQQSGHLEISTIKIQLLAYSNKKAGLAGRDRMRDYYLNLENLKATNELDVEKLLGDFWLRFLSNDEKKDALEILGLPETAQYDQAVNRYRQLASRHHPDKGGDKKKLQDINKAMAILKKQQMRH